jgi:hypothetical protein
VRQIGVAPLRIDMVTRIVGVEFEQVVADNLAFTLDGRRIPVIGREALLRNKLAVGRPQDLADAAALDAPLAPRDGESTS